MRHPARLLLLSGVFLVGCQAARDVAVTSFRVLDAPASYVRRKIDGPQTTTTTTTTVQQQRSDVANPGAPVVVSRPPATVSTTRPTRPPQPPASKRTTTANPSASDRTVRTTTSAPVSSPRPAPSATPRQSSAPQTAQFPQAKPVPGKPGYVYSIDPSGGIIDVTGYKSGDKAKDPYTGKIFLVP